MRGQLKEILLGINEVMNEQEMNLGGIYRMEFLDDLVRIYSSSVMDGNFLYSPTEGCREFAPQDLVADIFLNLLYIMPKLEKQK